MRARHLHRPPQLFGLLRRNVGNAALAHTRCLTPRGDRTGVPINNDRNGGLEIDTRGVLGKSGGGGVRRMSPRCPRVALLQIAPHSSLVAVMLVARRCPTALRSPPHPKPRPSRP